LLAPGHALSEAPIPRVALGEAGSMEEHPQPLGGVIQSAEPGHRNDLDGLHRIGVLWLDGLAARRADWPRSVAHRVTARWRSHSPGLAVLGLIHGVERGRDRGVLFFDGQVVEEIGRDGRCSETADDRGRSA
jgi:hypothetical protein